MIILIARSFGEFQLVLHAPPRVARQMEAAGRVVMPKTYIVSPRFAPEYFILPKEFNKIEAPKFDGLYLGVERVG